MTDSDSSQRDFRKSYGNKFIPYNKSLSKLFKDRFLCDVIIRVNTTTVHVHRVILSASSCFFYKLFKNVETINQEYDLTNVFIDPDNLDKILIYIYDGYVIIDKSNILSLLTINKVLGIYSLKNHCAQFLLSKLQPENVFETWQTAWKYNLKELANVSLIVCRECVSDTLLVKYNVIMLCEEFLSYVLAIEEVMAIVSPKSVFRMLVWWTSARKFDNAERSRKLLSLMDIYLTWKSLSETELIALMKNICKCFNFGPLVLNKRIKSWSGNKYKKISRFATIDGSNENIIDDILKNPQLLDNRQDWSLIVTENRMRTVGVYCTTKSKWFTMQTVDYPFKVIGFFNDSLVFRYSSNSLLLRNVNTMETQILTSTCVDDSVTCIETQNCTFFMHLNDIYSINAVMCTTEKDIICIINRWDRQRNEWITVLRLNPKLSSGILPVSLTVETSDGNNVYLFLTLRSSHKPSENTSESTAFKGKFVTRFGEEDPTVSQKLQKMFYVYCINIKDFSYRQIGKRCNELINLNTCRKILLQDKIIFLLDPDRDIDRKFGYAFHKKNDCHLSCLQLLLDGENCWLTLRLRVPFPDVRDISIRMSGRIYLDCSVTTCKNLLLVGIHWSPYVFQVFKYDMSTLIVSSLPVIPLPAISRMSVHALRSYQPISGILSKEIRYAGSLSFHFKDWSLLSWDGTSI